MILVKNENDNEVEVIYESSNVLASTYKKKEKDLIITFKHGGQYKYTNVGDTDYLRFETADSQGSVLNSHIKKYPFSNLGKVDVQEIYDKLSKTKSETINKAAVLILENMNTIYSQYFLNQVVDVKDILRLGETINVDFKKLLN